MLHYDVSFPYKQCYADLSFPLYFFIFAFNERLLLEWFDSRSSPICLSVFPISLDLLYHRINEFRRDVFCPVEYDRFTFLDFFFSFSPSCSALTIPLKDEERGLSHSTSDEYFASISSSSTFFFFCDFSLLLLRQKNI